MSAFNRLVLSLTINESPVAQPRPRAYSVGAFRSRIVSSPRNHPVVRFKAVISSEVERLQLAVLSGPLAVKIVFRMPRPKNKIWKRREMPRERHTSKPDLDNLVKSVMDACNGLLWLDDAQVCQIEVQKYIAAGDERPGVELQVLTIAEESICPSQ